MLNYECEKGAKAPFLLLGECVCDAWQSLIRRLTRLLNGSHATIELDILPLTQRMTGNHLEVLTASDDLKASALAAIAGFSRFRVWWLDRVRQTRTESATYLKEKGSAEWEVALGAEQLRQLHFEALTTIDRSSGHEEIRRCHQRLGGTRHDWDRLRNVGPFLVANYGFTKLRKQSYLDVR